MLPARCQKPPCMNMDVRIVAQAGMISISGGRSSRPVSTAGTRPKAYAACCAPTLDSSRCCHTYTSTQAMRIPTVTYGFVVVGLSSCRGMTTCDGALAPGRFQHDRVQRCRGDRMIVRPRGKRRVREAGAHEERSEDSFHARNFKGSEPAFENLLCTPPFRRR